MVSFRYLRETLKEELLGIPPAPPPVTTAAVPPQHDEHGPTHLHALLEANASVTAGVSRLHEHSMALEQQVQRAQTHLDPTSVEQQSIVSRLQQIIRKIGEELEALERANILMEQRLHEKRLLLDTRGEKLDQSARREAELSATITQLRAHNASHTCTISDLQTKLSQRETDYKKLQQQYDSLSDKHDTLVGTYHQLFQEYNRINRHEKRECIEGI